MRCSLSQLTFGLIWCVPCLGGAVRADTRRLAEHLEKFRHYKIYEMPAAEYKPIQGEYRTWINTRLMAGTSVAQMNEELQAANLLSIGPETIDDMFDRTYSGFLGEVETVPVTGTDDLLGIKFGVHTGGYCNFDETVLLYRRKPLRNPVQINAELVYTHGYRLRELAAGKDGSARGGIIGSAWVASNCTSNWNGNVFRIDRSRGRAIENILDQGVAAFNGEEMKISVEEDTVTFDYTTSTGETAALTREGIARYRVRAGNAVRQAPLAPSFGGFIAEGLTIEDTEAAHWSTAQANIQHHELAARLKNEVYEWEQVAECPGPPAAREVTIQWDTSKQTTVFWVSGSSAAEMRMLSISDEPSPSCRRIIRDDLTAILGEPPLDAAKPR
jgi:hypothetical protein